MFSFLYPLPVRAESTLAIVFLMIGAAVHAHGDHEHSGGRTHSFIENKGQFHDSVIFKSQLGNGSLFLEKNVFTYNLYDAEYKKDLHLNGHLYDPEDINLKCHAFKMRFAGANENAEVSGSDREEHYYNFFIGNNKSKHASHVNGYKEVVYNELYPGVDVHMYSKDGDIKYDFFVEPGADIDAVRWNYEGIEKVRVNRRKIVLKTNVGDLREEMPYAYQIIDGEEVEIKCRFEEKEDGTVGFNPGNDYNPEYPLVVDPTLVFSSYTGSTSNNFGYTATFDDIGFLYSGGTGFGVGYPTTTGAYDVNFSGGASNPGMGIDIVLTKWDTTGTSLIWSTYIGGSSDEMPHSLIVNNQQELIMMGTASSLDYPTTSGAVSETFLTDPSTPGINMIAGLGANYPNGSDFVVTRFNTAGSALIGSTYLGGSHNDGINNSDLRYNYGDEVRGEVFIDHNGDVLIASCTRSNDIPGTTGGFQSTAPTADTLLDGIIIKLNPGLTSVLGATYLGGGDDDAVYSITADDSNNFYVSGGTGSNNFPTTSGTLQPVSGGDIDAFVSHLSSDLSTLIAGTYRGTSQYDQSYFVERDGNNGDVYIFGQTEGPTNELIFNAQYNDPDGGQFITKYNAQLDALVWSTRFGTGDGTPDISPTAFMVDLCNAVYLSGWGSPIQGGNLSTFGLDLAGTPIQSTTDGADFYLMQLADDASFLQYATFIGGSAQEHVDGGTSRFDKKGKVYQAVCAGCPTASQGASSDFPTTPGAHSSTNNAPSGCNKAVFKIDFLLPAVISDFLIPNRICVNDSFKVNNISLEQNNTSFSWDFGDGTTSTLKEPTHVYTSPGTYDITLILADSQSCNLGDTLTKTIEVQNDTVFNFPDIAKCTYDTVEMGFLTLPEPDSAVYNWQPQTSIINPGNSIAQTYIDHDTTYMLVYTDGICSDTAYQKIEVDTVFAQAPPDTTVCSNDLPISFTGSAQGSAARFVWSSGANLPDTLNAPLTDSSFNANPASTSDFYFTAVSANGCIENDMMTLTLIDQDDPLIASFTQPDTGCAPYEITFQNTSDSLSDTYFTWSFGTGDSSQLSNPVFTYDSAGTYQVTLIATDTGICPQHDTTTAVISVRTDSTFNLDFEACINDSVPIGIEDDGVTQYTWVQPDAVTDSTIPDPFYLQNTDTTLILLASRICTDTFYNHITIDSIFVETDSALIICSDDLPFTLSGSGLGFAENFVWSSNSNFSDTLNSATTDSTLTSSQDQGFQRYHFKALSARGCSDTSSTIVAVSDLLIKAEPDTSICYGDTVTITAVNMLDQNQVNYSWEPVDDIISRPDSQTIIAAPLRDTEFTVTTVDDTGCVSSSSATVTVSNLNPETVSANSDRDTIIRVESVELIGTPDTGNFSFLWTPVENVSAPENPQTSANPQNTTTYTFRVTDNRVEECSYEDTTTVTVNDLICEPPVVYIPNAFTPDGDGLNEKLRVRGTHIREIELSIYNRWGEKVFETTDPEAGWDGTHNGQQVQSGVYVYHLRVICLDHQEYYEQGNVTVLK